MAMKRLDLADDEERARRTLDLFKRLSDLSDREIGEWLGVKYQAIEQRRKGYTRIRLPEIRILAEGFGIDLACFAMDDRELLEWIEDNRPDLLLPLSPWITTLRVVA